MNYIGLKYLFFRRPIDRNISKKLNFLPLYSKNNDYIITGTQLFPIDSNSNPDHIIMENMKQEDF